MPSDYIVENGDILFSWSGSLLVRPWTEGVGVLNQHLFKITSNIYPKWFFYLWTKYHLDEFIKIAEDKATTMGHIKRDHLSMAKTIIPTSAILTFADKQLSVLLNKSIETLLQAQEVMKLRDTLLPKLLSGELRIADVEKFVEGI